MINRIFWDLDETLISARLKKSEEGDFPFDVAIRVDEDIYEIKVNPYAWKLLSFSKSLVGKENVWLITTATRDYAEAAIRACDLGFPSNQILTREDIDGMIDHIRFDPEFVNPYKNKNNILIDNLPSRYNEEKMMILGIDLDRYYQVDDYYGVVGEGFEEGIVYFLNKKSNE